MKLLGRAILILPALICKHLSMWQPSSRIVEQDQVRLPCRRAPAGVADSRYPLSSRVDPDAGDCPEARGGRWFVSLGR